MYLESAKSKRNAQSYSLWLMPQGNAKDQLKDTIQSLGSDFDGPFFEPHVTLVSGFLGEEKKLFNKAKKISKKISPFIIVFDGIACLNEFFRSLYLKVKFNKSFISSRNTACNELGFIEHDYIPHLSLIYGNYTFTQKERMISRMGSLPSSFSVEKIFLTYNDEVNLKWRIIKEFSLSN